MNTLKVGTIQDKTITPVNLSVGGDYSHKNRPSYYALSFIVRTL